MGNQHPLFFLGNGLNRETHGRNRDIEDHVDLFRVVPAPGNGRANVRLELMVPGDHDNRLAQHLAAKILHGHLRGRDRTLSGWRGGRTGQIRQHADLHDVVRCLRRRNCRQQRDQPHSQKRQMDRPSHETLSPDLRKLPCFHLFCLECSALPRAPKAQLFPEVFICVGTAAKKHRMKGSIRAARLRVTEIAYGCD